VRCAATLDHLSDHGHAFVPVAGEGKAPAELRQQLGIVGVERDRAALHRLRFVQLPTVIGGLVNNLWSFAGDSDREDVNLMTVQPFVNYNFENGWYVSTSPVITANWEADGDDNTWTVPLGSGFGRLIRIHKLPLNLQAQAFYNVVKPDDAPTADWTLRLQVHFLFPK
jgi:hypothetical protein